MDFGRLHAAPKIVDNFETLSLVVSPAKRYKLWRAEKKKKRKFIQLLNKYAFSQGKRKSLRFFDKGRNAMYRLLDKMI